MNSSNTVRASAVSSKPNLDKLSNTERVLAIIDQLSITMKRAVSEIRDINGNTKLLALNARIEAARAGESGAAFGVVAQEMQALSGQTAGVAESLATRTLGSVNELVEIIGGSVRGTRLADLSLNSIDLVDRNLYERTCDVRWWATDAALVDALQKLDADTAGHASQRMGVILNAYTVYHDLVICDRNGRVVANGRPGIYSSVGRDEQRSAWFQAAMQSPNGEHFSFEGAHASALVNNQPSLIYACGVRKDGLSHGRVLGVLGVVFKWDTFARAILDNLPFDSAERERTTGLFLQRDGTILASCGPDLFNGRFPVERYERLMREDKGYVFEQIEGRPYCIAHARAPGFETYSTGWHSVLLQAV